MPRTEDRIHDMFINSPHHVPIAVRIESMSVSCWVRGVISNTARIDIEVVIKHRKDKWDDPDMKSTTFTIRSDSTYYTHDGNDRLPLDVLTNVHKVLLENGYVQSHEADKL